MQTTIPSQHARRQTCVSASEMPPPTSTQSELLAAAESFRAAIADLRHTVLDIWQVDDDTVIAIMDVSYRRLDGRELNLPCCNLFRVRDGLIDTYLIYMDVNPVIAP